MHREVQAREIDGGDSARISIGSIEAVLTLADRPFPFGPHAGRPITGRPGSGTGGTEVNGVNYLLELDQTATSPSRRAPTTELTVARWTPSGSRGVWLLAMCVRPLTAEEAAQGYADSLMTLRRDVVGSPAPTPVIAREVDGPTTPSLVGDGRSAAEASAWLLDPNDRSSVIELYGETESSAQMWLVQ